MPTHGSRRGRGAICKHVLRRIGLDIKGGSLIKESSGKK
jgi:hypothetical protein